MAALVRWESGLVLVLLASILFGASESPHFLTATDVFFIGLNMGEIAIMALPLTLIVMTGEIDLSVASMLGLSSTLLGYLFEHHWPIALAMVAVLDRRVLRRRAQRRARHQARAAVDRRDDRHAHALSRASPRSCSARTRSAAFRSR